MGGRGYHNDVQGYLRSDTRTSEYITVTEISNNDMEFIKDVTSPKRPLIPEFSNSPNKTYVLLNKEGSGIKNITVYDENHEQKFSIHLDHNHGDSKGIHVHSGMNTGRQIIPLINEYIELANKANERFKKRRK